MSGDLKKIVEYAEEFLEKSLESKIFLDLLDQAGLKIEHASKNDCLIYNDMPSKYIYILLKGACYSEKYSPSGKLLTAVACKPIEIYGLFEAVHPTLNRHTATIRCASDCSYIRIPIQTYLDQLSRDPEFGVLSLKHLSLLVERILNENEYLLLLHNPHCVNLAIKRIYEAHNAREIIDAKREHREPVIIPHFSCHVLRHTFCSRLCESDMNVKVIQEIMGHKNVETTLDIYTEVNYNKKKDSLEELASKMQFF